MSAPYASLEDVAIGDRVKYVPYHAHGDERHRDCEIGYVTSVNARLGIVFVRFSGCTSQGCNVDQLVRLAQ